MNRLGSTFFDIKDIPKLIETSFRAESEWINAAYTSLDKISSYLKNNTLEYNNFITEVKRRNIILVSNGEVISSDSTKIYGQFSLTIEKYNNAT